MAKDLIASFLPTAEVFPNRPLTLEIGADFGPFLVNLFSQRPTLIGTYTATVATNTLTLTAHGLTNGQMVQVTLPTPNGTLTDGLDTGELYFIINATANTFQLSLSVGGPVVTIKSADGGKVYKCGTPYNLTNCHAWAWVKHLQTDPDNALVLDLNASITGAALGFGYDWQITFNKTKLQTFFMTPGVHVWSLLLQFPDYTRRILIENSRFTIMLPSTHPPVAS